MQLTLLDQMAASRIADQIDNVGLGYPKKWIFHSKGLLKDQTEQVGETSENLRMSGSSGSRTDACSLIGRLRLELGYGRLSGDANDHRS
jgi:hypothetical protein